MRHVIRLSRKKQSVLGAIVYGFSKYKNGCARTDDFLSHTLQGVSPVTWYTPYDSIVVNGKITVVGSGDGYQTEIWNSLDGFTWTKVPNTYIWDIRSIAYGNGIYVAITQDCRLLCSTDAVNWAQVIQISSVPTAGQPANVCFGGGRFVAITTEGEIWRSASGTNWTYVTKRLLGKLSYTGTMWLGSGVVSGSYYTSSDGLSWYSQTGWGSGLTAANIVYSNGLYVAVRSDGYYFTGTDGINWKYWGTKLKAPLTKLVNKNNIVAYGAAGGYIVYSLDNGLTWNQYLTNPTLDFGTILLT